MHGCSNYKLQGINKPEIVVELVRTPACQAGGREFKSRRSRTESRYHLPLNESLA